MDLFDLAAVLVTLCAVFSWVNHRAFGLPTTIAVMLMALFVSLVVVALGTFDPTILEGARGMVDRVRFDETLMQGMLGFLLFAGALHVDLAKLREQGLTIGILATVGVITSTFIIGVGTHIVFDLVGLPLRLIDCLVFGALISPTDPIAVLAIVKQTRAPKSLQTKIVGESMFNDGVGVVVFLVLAGIATGKSEASFGAVGTMFAIEAVGGIVYGLAIGWIALQMLARVDNYQIEVLLTLALVMGGYALASALHTSGPLAMVVAGLLIGNHGRTVAMSEQTQLHLDTFWEIVDEILNAVLFVLIGFELLILEHTPAALWASLAALPLVLVSRLLAVGTPVALLRRTRPFSAHAIKVMTWGGLRGGISIALALSLPESPVRDALLVVTYAVVAFSITVQGLTIGPLLRRLFPEEAGAAAG